MTAAFALPETTAHRQIRGSEADDENLGTNHGGMVARKGLFAVDIKQLSPERWIPPAALKVLFIQKRRMPEADRL